eukprot:16438765-Heterocapsa_arctica.AAC.1
MAIAAARIASTATGMYPRGMGMKTASFQSSGPHANTALPGPVDPSMAARASRRAEVLTSCVPEGFMSRYLPGWKDALLQPS